MIFAGIPNLKATHAASVKFVGSLSEVMCRECAFDVISSHFSFASCKVHPKRSRMRRWSQIGYLDSSNMTYLSRLTMIFLSCFLRFCVNVKITKLNVKIHHKSGYPILNRSWRSRSADLWMLQQGYG